MKNPNDDWENPNDPDATITRMKNGTTRLAYKAEHAVDLESDLIVSATVHTGVAADTETVVDTAVDAAANLDEAGIENNRTTIVADKAYHSNSVMKLAADLDFTTVIPERTSPNRRRWTDKNPDTKRAVYNNRRRTKSDNGKLLSRARGELVERSFAHVCDTDGGRRTWHHGIEHVAKRHLMLADSSNLSTLMRILCGIGSPKSLQGLRTLLQLATIRVGGFWRASWSDVAWAIAFIRVRAHQINAA